MFTTPRLARAVLCGALFFPMLVAAAADSGGDLLQRINNALVEAAEKTARSVVVISVVRNQPAPPADAERPAYQNLPPDARHEFEKYFEDIPLDRRSGNGSGVIIRTNGFILTNRHVVENSETIEVRLRDGRNFPAKIHGSDPASDLAVIKIEAQDLPVAKFGNSDKLKVGELVIAVGSPYGLDYTTTFGHISATGRTYVLPGYTGAMMDQEFIQTDALISPGNSGGPLAGIDGEIIGINTLIQSQRAGIGFALPGNMAREIADHLVATGKYPRTWLGLDLRDLRSGDPLAEKGGDLAAGAVVSKIHPDSPAARSKLQALDIIQAIDGKPMKTSLEVRRAVRSARVGQVLVLDIVRASARLKLEVRAAAFDANEAMNK